MQIFWKSGQETVKKSLFLYIKWLVNIYKEILFNDSLLHLMILLTRQ